MKASPGAAPSPGSNALFLVAGLALNVSAQTTPEQILLKDFKPRTVFIAGHLANCCSDLNRLGAMLDQYPNLYADIGARFAELSPIPRTVSQFFTRYQDRVLYGTDMNPDAEMYRVTFRLLETTDEHFYPAYFRKYHWPMHAWALPDEVLRKIYRENALRLWSATGAPSGTSVREK